MNVLLTHVKMVASALMAIMGTPVNVLPDGVGPIVKLVS